MITALDHRQRPAIVGRLTGSDHLTRRRDGGAVAIVAPAQVRHPAMACRPANHHRPINPEEAAR